MELDLMDRLFQQRTLIFDLKSPIKLKTVQSMLGIVLFVTVAIQALMNFRDRPAVALNREASALQANGHLEDAEKLVKRAYSIDIRRHGIRHPSVARDLSNLALLEWQRRRVTEADVYFQSALSVQESLFGVSDRRLATNLDYYSQFLRDSGQATKSDWYAARLRALGGSHATKIEMGLGRLNLRLE